MAGDLVSAVGDLAQDVQVALGPLSYDDERGVLLPLGEGVEDAGGRLEAGADIEDQGHAGHRRITLQHFVFGDGHRGLVGACDAQREERRAEDEDQDGAAHHRGQW